mmetsp:Transcript_5019/g.13144  ORF Transcript_5019/g.13144 Transcript_5019/m.13144 type:complete len:300 (-) Transcript_5019:145-1044(-)
MAASTLSPLKSRITRTFPQSLPTSRQSPHLSVPRRRSTVADTPDFLSTLDSITEPSMDPSKEVDRSTTSDRKAMAPSRSSRPWPVGAATSTTCTSPPDSSTCTPWETSWSLTVFTSACFLSHLVMATMSGVLAAAACARASRVCGFTPSSAATTTTTTSVTAAPRARISLKALCPGVSRKVTNAPSSTSPEPTRTGKAPMCCVIPPASCLATAEERSASRRVVFPWSMWPMMETVGARFSLSPPATDPAGPLCWTEKPSSVAVISAAPHDTKSSDFGNSPRASSVSLTRISLTPSSRAR